MTEHLPPRPHHGGTGEIIRTIVLWLILSVLGWVGWTMNRLTDASNAQNVAQATMQAKFEDLEKSIKPVTDQVPGLAREVDKLDLQIADHERRIADLEQVRGLKR